MCVKLTCVYRGYVVAPIDEAVQVAELILSPHITEEHSRLSLIVREPRVNRAYRGQEVRLVERAKPDEGKRKWPRADDEVEGWAPIPVVPMRPVRFGGEGVCCPG